MDTHSLKSARDRAHARAVALREDPVAPTPTRTRLGTARTGRGGRSEDARDQARRPTRHLEPRLLRQTEGARTQIAAMLAMWAMFARGRRLNREAREAEQSVQGKLRAVAKRAAANVRPSTGRTFGTTASAVSEQICHAFSREDGAAGLPWPSSPGSLEEQSIEVPSGDSNGADDDDDELGGGGRCKMAMLVPHGDLRGMSGLTAAYGYRQLWESGDQNGLPDIIVIVGTSEPWGHGAADWEQAGFSSRGTETDVQAPVSHTETNGAVQGFSEEGSHAGKVTESVDTELNSETDEVNAHIDATLEMEVALCTDRWETPLGIVEPHTAMIEKLSACGYRVHSGIHRHQESIEAQLPFLQTLKPDVRIVPVLVGKLNRKMAAQLASDISAIIAGSGHSVGLLGCTNLGHSGPMYGRTRVRKTEQGTPYSHAQSDSDLADSLCAGASSSSVQAFNKRAQRANVCGRWTAIVLILAARRLNLRQGRVLARRMTVDKAQNTVGHAAIVFAPTAAEEERAPAVAGETPSLIKRASDGTIIAGTARVFTPAERIPKVVPNPENLRADTSGTTCHAIGDAMCYWHEQQTSKCIGVIITLPCFPRDEANEQDAAIDAYGSGRNRDPKMTPRTASDLSTLGASDLSSVGEDSGQLVSEHERSPSMSHSSARNELHKRVFDSNASREFRQSSIEGNAVDGLGDGRRSTAEDNPNDRMESTALKIDISSSSLNSSGSIAGDTRMRNAGRLVGQRKRMANGPGGLYTYILPEVRRQGWAVLQLIWPSWAEDLATEQLLIFAVLAARDAARWVLNVQERSPLVLIGWGSSADAAIEAGARLAWDHGHGTVDAVATLSAPGQGLNLAGVQTLPLCEEALQNFRRCTLLKMSGAEEYCPAETHALGGVLQRQAHVTSLISLLMERSKYRENGDEENLIERASRRPQNMHRSPAWMRLQARFGIKAQEGELTGETFGHRSSGTHRDKSSTVSR